MLIIYDQNFNQNEWFIMLTLSIGMTLVWLFRKRFPPKEVLAYFLFPVIAGMVFDHTISIEPFDFYDVNDKSSYELMDHLSYWMYGSFGYFYIYFYDYFKIKYSYTPVYILLWAAASVTMEFFAQSLGAYHYKNGYTIYYSFPIYLMILSGQIYFYKIIHADNA